jgi:hypothetical protein
MPSYLKPLVGSRPIHRDEKAFLPLQAADMFAWHNRRFYVEKWHGNDYQDSTWNALCTLTCAEDVWTEERLTRIFEGVRTSGLIFEYDLPPKLRKVIKKNR